jgi:hypothetical protein
MAFGSKARDPTTPYLVYNFVWRGKVFYVGLGQAKSTRHTHRWLFVKNLVEHEAKGTLKPGKRRALEGKSNSVLAALIRAGLEPHEVRVLWQGVGREQAKREEKRQISVRVAQGCILANVQGLPVQRSLGEVLEYLGAGNAV